MNSMDKLKIQKLTKQKARKFQKQRKNKIANQKFCLLTRKSRRISSFVQVSEQTFRKLQKKRFLPRITKRSW